MSPEGQPPPTCLGCTVDVLDGKDRTQSVQQDFGQRGDELSGGDQHVDAVGPEDEGGSGQNPGSCMSLRSGGSADSCSQEGGPEESALVFLIGPWSCLTSKGDTGITPPWSTKAVSTARATRSNRCSSLQRMSDAGLGQQGQVGTGVR